MGLFGIFKDGRPDHDPLAQVPGKDLDQVRLIGKPFRIVGVDDELRALEFDLRNRDAPGHLLVDFFSLTLLSRSSICILLNLTWTFLG